MSSVPTTGTGADEETYSDAVGETTAEVGEISSALEALSISADPGTSSKTTAAEIAQLELAAKKARAAEAEINANLARRKAEVEQLKLDVARMEQMNQMKKLTKEAAQLEQEEKLDNIRIMQAMDASEELERARKYDTRRQEILEEEEAESSAASGYFSRRYGTRTS